MSWAADLNNALDDIAIDDSSALIIERYEDFDAYLGNTACVLYSFNNHSYENSNDNTIFEELNDLVSTWAMIENNLEVMLIENYSHRNEMYKKEGNIVSGSDITYEICSLNFQFRLHLDKYVKHAKLLLQQYVFCNANSACIRVNPYSVVSEMIDQIVKMYNITVDKCLSILTNNNYTYKGIRTINGSVSGLY